FVSQSGQADGGGETQASAAGVAGTALMLTFPKRFWVPQAYRHPHFLLLPTTPAQAVGEFVAMQREREQLHQLFRPQDVWPSDQFSLSQHEGDLEWQQAEFLAKRSFSYGLWSPDRELQFWGG